MLQRILSWSLENVSMLPCGWVELLPHEWAELWSCGWVEQRLPPTLVEKNCFKSFSADLKTCQKISNTIVWEKRTAGCAVVDYMSAGTRTCEKKRICSVICSRLKYCKTIVDILHSINKIDRWLYLGGKIVYWYSKMSSSGAMRKQRSHTLNTSIDGFSLGALVDDVFIYPK